MKSPAHRVSVEVEYRTVEEAMWTPVILVLAHIRVLAQRLRHDEGGYTTETVLVTAALVALALIVIGLIVAVVTRKAQSIQF